MPKRYKGNKPKPEIHVENQEPEAVPDDVPLHDPKDGKPMFYVLSAQKISDYLGTLDQVHTMLQSRTFVEKGQTKIAPVEVQVTIICREVLMALKRDMQEEMNKQLENKDLE